MRRLRRAAVPRRPISLLGSSACSSETHHDNSSQPAAHGQHRGDEALEAVKTDPSERPRRRHLVLDAYIGAARAIAPSGAHRLFSSPGDAGSALDVGPHDW